MKPVTSRLRGFRRNIAIVLTSSLALVGIAEAESRYRTLSSTDVVRHAAIAEARIERSLGCLEDKHRAMKKLNAELQKAEKDSRSASLTESQRERALQSVAQLHDDARRIYDEAQECYDVTQFPLAGFEKTPSSSRPLGYGKTNKSTRTASR